MIYQHSFANNSVIVKLENGVVKEIPLHIFNDILFQWGKEKRELDKLFDCRHIPCEGKIYNRLQDRWFICQKELQEKYKNIISEYKEG